MGVLSAIKDHEKSVDDVQKEVSKLVSIIEKVKDKRARDILMSQWDKLDDACCALSDSRDDLLDEIDECIRL